MLNDNGELIAADPRKEIWCPDLLVPALRHLPQDCIADDVAVSVVERLEVVEVEIEESELLVAPSFALLRRLWLLRA